MSAAPELTLLIPENDVTEPEVSIVIPTLNERITIVDFLNWCKEGLASAGVVGEILIVDSSEDETPWLAVANGARVLRTPKRGLGRAYIDAVPYIRGKYVLMGDADCTYDFRDSKGSSPRFALATSTSWGRGSRATSSPDRCPRSIGTSARR